MTIKTNETNQPADHEVRAAHEIRLTLAALALYPGRPLEADDGFSVLEAKTRAELHQLVDQLGRTDLLAVRSMVQILVRYPHTPALFKTIEQRNDRLVEAIQRRTIG